MIRLKNSELNLVEKTEQKLNRVDFIPPVTGRERTKNITTPSPRNIFPFNFTIIIINTTLASSHSLRRHTSKYIISLVLSPSSFSGFHCADDFSSHNGIINCRLPVSTFSLHEPSQALEYLLSPLDLIIIIIVTFVLHY
ncbi:hypothetical protein P8452_22757 [Trifolium repens]|nr:hypothetical protein P8452_22757 [Trifolium repens]